MLGLRRFQGFTIDLWQGDPGNFVADLRLQYPVTCSGHGSGEIGSNLASDLTAAAQGRERHVLVVVGPVRSAAEPAGVMAVVKGVLTVNRGQQGGLQRITFALPDLCTYSSYQEALFREFPEIP